MLREIFLITTFFCSGSSLCGGTVYSNKPTIAEHTENNTSSFVRKTLYCFFHYSVGVSLFLRVQTNMEGTTFRELFMISFDRIHETLTNHDFP